jgi:alpha-ribazole phosphatase
MQVYLIRHTSPDIAPGICYGQSDLALKTELFEAEFKAIQAKIPAQFSQVYSSPLQRCQQLAQCFCAQPMLDDRLKELNFGQWEMQAWDKIPQHELDPWMANFVNIAPPDGENFQQLYQRNVDFIKQLLTQNIDNVAIITHAGNIRSWLSFVLGLPLENSFKIKLNYGAVVLLSLDTKHNYHQLHSIG